MAKTDLREAPPQPVNGIPFVPGSTPVSDWSMGAYKSLQDWSKTYDAKWEWWEPGYLMLTIIGDEHGPIEPVFIDTAEDELTVAFGMWETHLPSYNMATEDELASSVSEAKQLSQDWITERLLSIVFFNAEEKWCGSLTSLPEELDSELLRGAAWIMNFGPKRAEVRAARREQWRFFDITPEGKPTEQFFGMTMGPIQPIPMQQD